METDRRLRRLHLMTPLKKNRRFDQATLSEADRARARRAPRPSPTPARTRDVRFSPSRSLPGDGSWVLGLTGTDTQIEESPRGERCLSETLGEHSPEYQ